uniref:Apolipoprotein Eb n=1 Tax=Oryzias melastigma TaxID=30732 RepID=A0A3B3CFC9_ORYME
MILLCFSGVSVSLATMKAVALILALAVITGCNARAVRQAETSMTRVEDSVDRFWQYIQGLSKDAQAVVDTITAGQMKAELESLITQTMTEVAEYKESALSKLGPLTTSTSGQVNEDLKLLINKLQKDMTDAKDRSTEYLGELNTMVTQNADDVRSRITAYTNKLRKRLIKDTAEIREAVATYMGEVHSRATQNADAVREQGDTIRTQLENSMRELRTSMDTRLEELTELIVPYATKIREQFEEVMTKVKDTTIQ